MNTSKKWWGFQHELMEGNWSHGYPNLCLLGLRLSDLPFMNNMLMHFWGKLPDCKRLNSQMWPLLGTSPWSGSLPSSISTTLTKLCCVLIVCNRPNDYALSIGCVSYISNPVFLPGLTAGPCHKVSLSRCPCISILYYVKVPAVLFGTYSWFKCS